jgi:superfamily II DNA/RNA helicase
VLDEADRMLDMGFSDDIMQIASLLPKNRQTVMFSATMPDKIQQLAKSMLYDPVMVKIAVSRPAEKIKQSAYVCYEPQKLAIVKYLFATNQLQRVIIFSGKKDKVKDITRELKRMKINCEQMHSDLTQQERDEVMLAFKARQVDVLIATDIVSRGIDIDDIRMVINYDVPHDAEDYVHRIGRTARAERDGMAVTFVNEQEQFAFRQIEKFLGKEVEKTPLPADVGEGPVYEPKDRTKRASRYCHRRGRGRGKGRGRDNKKKQDKR